VKAGARCPEEVPKERKTYEGIGLRRGLNRRVGATDRNLEQGPEGGASALESRGNPGQGPRPNDKRARVVDEADRLGCGENPWKVNPGRGCGVKQTHEVLAGENRRGRAKRRGRTVGRGWKPGRKWIARTRAAMRTENSKEGARRVRATGRFEAVVL